MKLSKYLIGVFSLLILFSVATFAQEKEMTKDEWQAEMTRLQTEKASLMKEDSSLKADIATLKTKDANLQSYGDCKPT